MTLCKYRPQRTYDAQFIIDLTDTHGLMKALDQVIHELGEDGDSLTPYYVGARLALSTLLDTAYDDGMVDYWTDFMRAFEKSLQELEGGEE
ncbi:MAG: hypothetical protein IKF14_05125 [Atopobiaceae bacterium]|nr:hypothetical protein [Atopobiaceae bacterium]MBR3158471.1 hypothetical protein [Atopobiaceae bacterium]